MLRPSILLPVSMRIRAGTPPRFPRTVQELLVREVRGEDKGALRDSVFTEGLGRPAIPPGAKRLGGPLLGGWKGNKWRGF